MSYGYEYVKLVETSKTLELVSFGDKDAYDLYLSANRRRYPSPSVFPLHSNSVQ